MSGYDKYVRGKVLGKGSFGQAVLVTNKTNGKNYVIKEIDISRMPKAERESSEQEAKLLMALSHPNIVRCLECFTHQSKLCIVMDWCSEGDLYGITQKRRGAPLPEDTILDWFVQMCLGLKHVHDRKILHRDIKTQNIFMSAGGILKLGDFGVSKILASTWQLAATAVGTPYYLSPEICQNRRYNQKSDIWSLGCVLYELTVGKHAFEAPNMRALIQKIIKGQYPPVPATRSKDLRDLIDRMLTLNWEKRPSINDILATPVMKARITKFLSATLQAHEFSHTIIHGKPERGQLVVASAAGAAPTPLPPAAYPGAKPSVPAPVAAAGPAVPPRLPVVAAAAQPRPGALAAPAVPAALVKPGSASGAGQKRGPSPPSAGAAAAAAAAARQRAAEAAAAAKNKAQQAAKEREEAAAAAAAAAAARREDEGRRQREAAAVAAHREGERMKLEDQRKKIEAERQRLESDRKKAEAARQEAERKAKLLEDAARKAANEDAKKRAEAEARRAKAQDEAQRKDAERAERERKREDERARMAQQKREYYEKQQAAARNKAAVENQIQNGQIQIIEAPGAARQRRQWQSPELPTPNDRDRPPSGADKAGPVALTPEQRRAVWEEQRAAAERNRRAAAEAEQGGGLANFLGVPTDDEPQVPAHRRKDGPSPDDRREIYLEQRAAAERNRHRAEDRPYSAGLPKPPVSVQEAFEKRRRKLEDEAAARDAQIREYQKAHWKEMREAAARNKAAIMAEVAGPGGAAPAAAGGQLNGDQQEDAGNGAGAEDLDFAAMIRDMQDVLGTGSVSGEAEQQPPGSDDDDDGEGDDDQHAAALAGRFLLNGSEIPLPVHQNDSLAAKVEALRCYLEEALGTQPFLKVYRRLESLSLEDDEAEVSKEFLAVLGADKLPYLQLIHQLIVCEENLNSTCA